MNDAALAVAQARYALKGFLREPRTFVYTLVLPLFLLVILNGIFRGRSSFFRLQVPFAVYYTPAIISYQIMLAGYSSLLIAVTTERERGMLKRLRGRPCRAGSSWPGRSCGRSSWSRSRWRCWSRSAPGCTTYPFRPTR